MLKLKIHSELFIFQVDYVPRQECNTIQVPQVSQVPEEKCQQVPEQKCSTVQEQECHTEYEKECNTRHEQECHDEYKEECHTVNEQVCDAYTETKVDYVTKEKCATSRPVIHSSAHRFAIRVGRADQRGLNVRGSAVAASRTNANCVRSIAT